MSKFKCLVIGYGSIGQRHTRILNELGHQVSIVSSRIINYPLSYQSIESALANENYDYIVIANDTNKHFTSLNELEKFVYTGKVLVEKPLYSLSNGNEKNNSSIYVGYNLRFHPIIKTLADKLEGVDIVSVQCYVGQYLPTWRPSIEYTSSYSSTAAKGGGVIRDLSHELDYLHLLFGEWNDLTASGGKFSDLKITSDDHFSFIYNTDKVPLITLHMNYLDHITQRNLTINTNEKTYKADFKSNTLQINDEIIEFDVDRDETYRKQHVAILNDDYKYVCTYQEGLKIVKMIEIAEIASREKVWITNE